MVLVPASADLLGQQPQQQDHQSVGLAHVDEEGEQEQQAVHHRGRGSTLRFLLIMAEGQVGRHGDHVVDQQQACAVGRRGAGGREYKQSQEGQKDFTSQEAAEAASAHGKVMT